MCVCYKRLGEELLEMSNHCSVAKHYKGHLKVEMERLVKNFLELQVLTKLVRGASNRLRLIALDVCDLEVVKHRVMKSNHRVKILR